MNTSGNKNSVSVELEAIIETGFYSGTCGAFQQMVEHNMELENNSIQLFEFTSDTNPLPFAPLVQIIQSHCEKHQIDYQSLCQSAGVIKKYHSNLIFLFQGKQIAFDSFIFADSAHYHRLEIFHSFYLIFQYLSKLSPIHVAIAGIQFAGRTIRECLLLLLERAYEGRCLFWVHIEKDAVFEFDDDQQSWLEFVNKIEDYSPPVQMKGNLRVLANSWPEPSFSRAIFSAQLQLVESHLALMCWHEARDLATKLLRRLQVDESQELSNEGIKALRLTAVATLLSENYELARALFEQLGEVAAQQIKPGQVAIASLYSAQCDQLLSKYDSAEKMAKFAKGVAARIRDTKLWLFAEYLLFVNSNQLNLDFEYSRFTALLASLEKNSQQQLLANCRRSSHLYIKKWTDFSVFEAQDLVQIALKYYNHTKNWQGIVSSYQARAALCLAQNQIKNTIRNLDLSYKVCQKLGDEKQTISLQNSLGYFYGEIEQFNKAEKFHVDAFHKLIKNPNFDEILVTLFHLSWLYFNQKNYVASQELTTKIQRFLKILEINRLLNHSLADCEVLNGLCQYYQGDVLSARGAFDSVSGKIKDLNATSLILYQQLEAWLLVEQGGSDQAIELMELLLQRIGVGLESSIHCKVNLMADLATMFDITGNEYSARDMLQQAELICEQMGLSRSKIEIQSRLKSKSMIKVDPFVPTDIHYDLDLLEQLAHLRMRNNKLQLRLKENSLHAIMHRAGVNAASFDELTQSILEMFRLHIEGAGYLFAHVDANQKFDLVASLGDIADTNQIFRNMQADKMSGVQMRNRLYIPVLHQNRLVAAIVVLLRPGHPFIFSGSLEIYDALGHQIGLFMERLERENDLIFLRRTCPLTGLLNRQALYDSLSNEMKHYDRYSEEKPFSIAFVDFDNFKYYNDRFGHSIGDRLLQEFAKLVASLIRETDLAARIGGDEFVIMLHQTNGENAVAFGNRLIKLLADERSFHATIEAEIGEAISVPEESRLSCSIGISEYQPRQSSDSVVDPVEALLIQSDKAMYRAKMKGKSCASL